MVALCLVLSLYTAAALSTGMPPEMKANLKIVADMNKLLARGTLVRCKRPADYRERREDGYVEPETVYVLGTDHRSRASAAAARAAVLALKPDVVVLELCRTRQALLVPTNDVEGGQRQAAEVRGGELAFGGGRSDGSYADSLRTALKSGSVGAVALRLVVARAFDATNGGASLDSAVAPAGADFRAANEVRRNGAAATQRRHPAAAQQRRFTPPHFIRRRRRWGRSWRWATGRSNCQCRDFWQA